jgi:uncharacterized pyridoxal phosphate-dependent enzyme
MAVFTRRLFLQWQTALASLPFLSSVDATGATTGTSKASVPDYYDKIGVEKIINAAGVFTVDCAATMPPVVEQAVAQAAKHPVRLQELQKKSGEYIAQKLRCEGAVVTCGASSALTLGTAACVQAANNCKPTDIPQEIGSARFPKNEVIVQKAHRYGYDHAMFLCGVKIVEVVTMEDYKGAFGPNTVMTNFFNAGEDAQIGQEDWLRVAHEHNVPCHLDAAADMPPIENLWKYTGMGWDLVCFSGGKGIRGPQNAGLLLGKKRLTDLAHANNSPGDGVGRGMKVAKEQMVGMVAAVDWVLTQSDEQWDKEFTRRANVIGGMVKDLPGVTTSIETAPIANHVPHLYIHLDPVKLGLTPKEALMRLQTGTPSIEIHPSTGQKVGSEQLPSGTNALIVGTWMLNPGDEFIVGRQIRKLLTKPESVGVYAPRVQS